MPPTSAVRVPILTGTIFFVALLLAGCHGSGGGSAVVPASSGTGSQLYVGGNGGGTLLIYNDANAVTGGASANRIVAGGLTALNAPRGIAVDMARNQIYVANFSSDSILVFHNARTVTGGDAPNRTITGAPLSRPSALFADVVNNRLFVANTNGNSILIYNDASTLNGGVAPTRTLSGVATTLSAPLGVYVDTTRNLLYVSNGNNQILVFSNAASVTGNVAPIRTVSGLSSPRGIYVDVMADRLYVANTGANSIVIFNGASTASGSPAPDRTLSGDATQLNQPIDVFLDTGADRLYVANFGGNSVLVFNGASTVDGNVTPDRNLSLTASTGPWGVCVDVTPIVIGSTASLDGYALSTSGVPSSATGSPATGDKDSSNFGVGWRQLYSFDIALASILPSTTITSATLRLYQCDVVGSPYGLASLGNVIIDHVNYGGVFDPFGSAYNGATETSNIGILSATASLGYRSLDVTTWAQNDQAESRVRSQYRLRFSLIDSNSDFSDDFVQFTDAEGSLCAGTSTNQPPQLAITLKP